MEGFGVMAAAAQLSSALDFRLPFWLLGSDIVWGGSKSNFEQKKRKFYISCVGGGFGTTTTAVDLFPTTLLPFLQRGRATRVRVP